MSTCAKCGKNARLDTRPNAPHVWIGCDCNPDVPEVWTPTDATARVLELLSGGWLDSYPVAYELVWAAIAGDEALAKCKQTIGAARFMPDAAPAAPASIDVVIDYMRKLAMGDTPARIQPTRLGPISPAMYDALVATPEPVLCACGCAEFVTSIVPEVSPAVRIEMRCRRCGSTYSRRVT